MFVDATLQFLDPVKIHSLSNFQIYDIVLLSPIQSLDWEDLLEEEMATYSTILAWRIPWTEEPVGLWSMG